MPIALTPNETKDYQLIEDRLLDADGKRSESSKLNPDGTVFHLRALTPHDEAEIQNKQFSWSPAGEIESYNIGSEVLARLERGLAGWANFNDTAGKPVEFKTSGRLALCHMDNLARLNVRQRGELAGAHRRLFSITADEGN